jgi:hypothetical protein
MSNGERRSQPIRRALWISPGARLGLLALLLAVTMIVVFVAIPFYGDRAQRKEAAKVALMNQQARERRATALLHRFDCTYGVAMREALLVAIGNQEAVKLNARTPAVRRAAARDEHRFQVVLRKIKPLGPHVPCH